MTLYREVRKEVKEILVCVFICILVTIITNRILAIHTFKVIDGYVKELFEITKESIRDAYSDK